MVTDRPALGRPWRRTVAYVLQRDGYRCQLAYPGTWTGVHGQQLQCLGTATTADHITPRSQNGSDDPSNLRASCQPCNQHRSDGPTPTTDHDRHSRSWTTKH